MAADKLVHKVNDASDAVSDARAMVWAIFYMAQGMPQQSEVTNALTACCNQALCRLRKGSDILEDIAASEREKEGA